MVPEVGVGGGFGGVHPPDGVATLGSRSGGGGVQKHKGPPCDCSQKRQIF